LVHNKGYNASVLSRYTKEFTNKKWLIELEPKTYPRMYRATPKAPISATGEKGQVLRSGELTRINNTRYHISVLSDVRREITWDKVSRLKNGVKVFYMYFPSVTIAFYSHKKSRGKVVLFPTHKYLDDVEMKHHVDIIKQDMRVARDWLQRVLLCRLSVPVAIVDKEFAKPIRNPMIMRVLERVGAFRIGDCWIDASKMGFRSGEIESTDPEKLQAMKMLEWGDAGIPGRVSSLEDNMSDIRKAIDDLPRQIGEMIAPKRDLPPDDFSYR
jgi:hypothetical protein